MEVAFDARYIRTTDSEVRPSGGIGRYSLRLIQHLLELDPDLAPTLLVPAENGRPVLDEPAARRVTEVRVAAPPHGLRSLLGLHRRVDLTAFDLYHGPFNVLPVKIPCKTVATVHDVMWLSHPEYCMRHHLNRMASAAYFRFGIGQALRHATRILTVSHASRRAIEAEHPATRGRVRVTYNGLDPAFRPMEAIAAREATADLVPVDAPFVLSVGQGSPYKNQRRAVLAFLRAFRSRPAMRLVLLRRFSRRGDQDMRRLLATPQARRQVITLAGASDLQLRGLYNRARIFLFPSLEEGFGLPALEAMACGTPVVTSDGSAPAEVTGQAALHVDPRSTDAIARALVRLDGDAELRRNLSARGRRRAASFTWRACAEGTLAAYREALADPGA